MNSDAEQSLELEKLHEEIKSLRIQRILLILAVFGSIASFLVTNYADIRAILQPAPRVSVLVADPFLKSNGVLEIKKLQNGKWSKIIQTSLEETEEWISLSEGSFLTEIQLNNETVFSQEWQLRNGDARIAKFEDRISGPIRVRVVNKTRTLLPNTPLKMDIYSSGKGYIWAFDITPKKQLKLIYPESGSEPSMHEISPESKYQIPDRSNYGIFSGKVLGQEKLLILVTATPSESIALNLASNFSSKTETKAEGGTVEVDWGAAVESYEVKLP